jgi:hypothetical protein
MNSDKYFLSDDQPQKDYYDEFIRALTTMCNSLFKLSDWDNFIIYATKLLEYQEPSEYDKTCKKIGDAFYSKSNYVKMAEYYQRVISAETRIISSELFGIWKNLLEYYLVTSNQKSLIDLFTGILSSDEHALKKKEILLAYFLHKLSINDFNQLDVLTNDLREYMNDKSVSIYWNSEINLLNVFLLILSNDELYDEMKMIQIEENWMTYQKKNYSEKNHCPKLLELVYEQFTKNIHAYEPEESIC